MSRKTAIFKLTFFNFGFSNSENTLVLYDERAGEASVKW